MPPASSSSILCLALIARFASLSQLLLVPLLRHSLSLFIPPRSHSSTCPPRPSLVSCAAIVLIRLVLPGGRSIRCAHRLIACSQDAHLGETTVVRPLTQSQSHYDFQASATFRGIEDIELYVDVVSHDPTASLAITDLIFFLPSDIGYPARLVRDSIRLSPNTEFLCLRLPRSTPDNILDNIRLEKLTGLLTNLPHGHLTSLLSNHATVDTLVLEGRGCTSSCPLRDLNLRHVTDLKCSSRCFSGIARGQVTSAIVSLSRQNSMPSVAIRSLSTSPIHTLSIDFYPDDYDILSLIAAAAPNLRKLKLWEKPRVHVRNIYSLTFLSKYIISVRLYSAVRCTSEGRGMTSTNGVVRS